MRNRFVKERPVNMSVPGELSVTNWGPDTLSLNSVYVGTEIMYKNRP